jgi:hypothetical protein
VNREIPCRFCFSEMVRQQGDARMIGLFVGSSQRQQQPRGTVKTNDNQQQTPAATSNHDDWDEESCLEI